MNPIPLKCDQKNASVVIQNGHYYSDVSPEMLLENGDVIVARNDFIDTNQLSAATFFFEEDTTFVISGILYETNTSITDKTAVKGSLDVDYKTYTVQLTTPGSEGSYKIFTQQVTIPAGPYEPERLASTLTDALSYVQPLDGETVIETGSQMLINSEFGLGGGGVAKIDFKTPAFTDRNQFGPGGTDYYNNVAAQYYSLSPGANDPTDGEHYQHVTPASTSGTGTGLVIRFFIAGPNNVNPSPTDSLYVVVDAGSGYQLNDTITFTSDQFAYWEYPVNGDNIYDRCPKGGTVTYSITNISDANAFYELTLLGDPPVQPTKSYQYTKQYFLGASEVDLTFDTTFQWNFLHTPEYDTATDPAQPAVSIIKDATTSEWYTINRASGFAITSVSPAAIWQKMGFNLDNQVCKVFNVDTGVLENITTNTDSRYPIDADSFNRSTTSSYLGLNALLNNKSSKGSREVPTANIIEATTLTNKIVAPNYRADTGSGHYVVQIYAGYDQIASTGEGGVQIGAIVSKQWGNNDIVSGFGDSGIVYQHRGAPLSLSRIEIKILDGETMEVPSTLGSNQCIYLQLNKAATVANTSKSSLPD